MYFVEEASVSTPGVLFQQFFMKVLQGQRPCLPHIDLSLSGGAEREVSSYK